MKIVLSANQFVKLAVVMLIIALLVEEIDREALALVQLAFMMMEKTIVPPAIINVEHAKINQKIA